MQGEQVYHCSKICFRGDVWTNNDEDIVPRCDDTSRVMTSAAGHVAGYSRNSIFTSFTSHLSVAFFYATHHRSVGDYARIDVYKTGDKQIWTTIFDEELFHDSLHESTCYCGARYGRWSYEILGVGTIPKECRVYRYTFRVDQKIKEWCGRYQKNQTPNTWNTLPPVADDLKKMFRNYLPSHACRFDGWIQKRQV